MSLPGPVTIPIVCRTTPDRSAGGARHDVTLLPDGTVETPHDLSAERLAVALGGYLTCVELVDRTVPVFREWLELRHRIGGPPIRSRDAGRRWHAKHRAACCPRAGYDGPVAAADHARTSAHLSVLRGADADQLQQLARAAQRLDPPQSLGQPWDTLWACGITEEAVARIDQACGIPDPLEPAFYLAVLQHKPALPWLRDLLAAAPVARATAEWLAWTYGPADRRDPGARRAWLRLAVPVRAMVGLMAAGSDPGEVERIAAHWGITHASAALVLLEWQEQDLAATAADLTGRTIGSLGYPPRPPGRRNVAELRRRLPAGSPTTDLDAALAIIEHGSIGAAAAALGGGG
jgi:hypothetical protein